MSEIPVEAQGTWDELYGELASAARSGGPSAGAGGGDGKPRVVAPPSGPDRVVLAQLKLLMKSEQRSYDLWKTLLLGAGCFALVTLAVLVVQLFNQPDISTLTTGAGLVFESGAAVFLSSKTKSAKSSLRSAINGYAKASKG